MNVLIVLVDTLRADHLRNYGYGRRTSPYIDGLAAEGAVFNRAYSCTSYTCESVSSLFTGLLPWMSGTGRGWLASPTPMTKNMAELFLDAGYVTGLFTCNPALYDPAFDVGFAETDHLFIQYGARETSHVLSERVLEFAARHVGRKTLTYVHYMDPHAPYQPPDSMYLRFAPSVYPTPITFNPDVVQNIPALVASGFGPGEARFDDMVLRYDAEIADSDDAIGTLLSGLEALGTLEETLVIVMADHGEEFLEHGYVGHCHRVYRESTNIPLVFWAPGFLAAQRIRTRVSVLNILPTLLELAGIPHSRTDFYGESLFHENAGTWTFAPPTKPLISEMLLETRSIIHAVTSGNYRYTASPRWLSVGECCEEMKHHAEHMAEVRSGTFPLTDPWAAPVHEELFDVVNDPNERENIIGSHPSQANALRSALNAYHTMAEAMPKVVIPPQERPPEPVPTTAYPKLTDISPWTDCIGGGAHVRLYGVNLWDATVTFGGTAPTTLWVSPTGTQILATAPAHVSGPVAVHVSTPIGDGNSLAFVYERERPTARFAASPRTGTAPLMVDFTDSSLPGESSITAWEWHFGDGQGSTERNPSHTYLTNGAYTVTLRVTSDAGSDEEVAFWYVDVGHVLPATGGWALLPVFLALAFTGMRALREPGGAA